MSVPRVLVAGLSGGAGKTLVSVGIVAAWRGQGRAVAVFKKGPDYIDAAWLARAAGAPCRNLDLFLMPPDTVRRSFARAAGDVALIEGNRGLYDGLDARGSASSAELAMLLDTPVLLVVDATKATRTVAAQVLGCQRLDPRVRIAGVVLNRVAGARHQAVLREAIPDVCGVPVLGALPKIADPLLTDRHLGLVPPAEHGRWRDAVAQAGDLARAHLDLPAVAALAAAAPPLAEPAAALPSPAPPPPPAVRIGVLRDAAFQFYYPENLEALEREGAALVEVSPLRDAGLPELDALYIGGGFPETLAAALSDNGAFRRSVREAAAQGLPIYAECGGAIFLGERLAWREAEYPMAGVLPVAFSFEPRPQGHGYTALEVVADNPFFAAGAVLQGHEFHYSGPATPPGPELRFAFRVRRGHGFDGARDGLRRYNVLASYTHVHALGTTCWAPGLVAAARRHHARPTRRAPAPR